MNAKPLKIHSLLLISLMALACTEKTKQTTPASQLPTSGDFRKGEYFNDSTSHKDSAFFYFNNVTETSGDSLLAGMAYAYMATIQSDAGDFFGAQETALAGINLLVESNPEHLYCLASLYNVLGRSNLGLRDYDNAADYFRQALKLQPYEGYKNLLRNNIAVALRDKGDYAGALRELNSIVPEQTDGKAEQARRIT
ncbi:MAG: tetratricopeptide repeat protein, partial [Chitinophagaceae bacterium]